MCRASRPAHRRRPLHGHRPSPHMDRIGAQAALRETRRRRLPMEMSDYQLAGCRLVTRATSGTQAVQQAMTDGNLLSACPRAECGRPAGRSAELCDPPVDRSPDSRIDAERQGLPMPARPSGRVGSPAGAKLRRRIRRAEHSDRRPSAPACRPLPAYSGGTVWDSHPLPGIVGSRAVAGQYSTSTPIRRTGVDGRRARPAATPGRAARPGGPRPRSAAPSPDHPSRPNASVRGATRLHRYPFPQCPSLAIRTAPSRQGASPPAAR